MSRPILAIHDAKMSEPDDFSLLESTLRIAAPGEYAVVPDDRWQEGVTEDCVIVAVGKDAAEALLHRKVTITGEAGRVEKLQHEGQSYDLVLQLSPGYIRNLQQKKGGNAEKMNRLWLDVWEQVAKHSDGEVVAVEPETTIITNEDEVIALLERLTQNEDPQAYDYETWGDTNALRPELNRAFKIVSCGVAWLETCVCGGDGFGDHPTIPCIACEGRGKQIKAAAFLFDRPKKASARLEEAWLAYVSTGTRIGHFSRYEHKCNIKRFGRTWTMQDTLLMLHALDELADGSLERVMFRCGLHWGGFKSKYDATRKDPMRAEVPVLLRYNGLDAFGTLGSSLPLQEELEKEDMTHIARQNEGFSADLAEQEMVGLRVSQSQVVYMRDKVFKDSDRLLAELRAEPLVRKVETWALSNIKSYRRKKEAIFNPKSTPMMRQLILKELKFKMPTIKKNGKPTQPLDNKALEKYEKEYPVVKKLNDYRSNGAMVIFLKKWDTYIGPTQCVHTSYNQTIVVTGRLSSTNPPLQNIPKDHEIRTVFVSRFPNGWMINADYAQQEPRLIAGWSGARAMIDAILAGKDFHAWTAGLVYDKTYEEVMIDHKSGKSKERDFGKRMNLGLAYGQTEFGLAAKTGKSVDEARALMQKYDNQLPEIPAWRGEFHKQAIRHGYVEDLFGARRHLPGAQSSDKWERDRALRQAGNFPVQGTAFRFTQIAAGVLIALLKEHCPGRAFVVGQVHDSIIVDAAPEVAGLALGLTREAMLIHNEMDYWKEKGMPMQVDLKIGRNLYDMKVVK